MSTIENYAIQFISSAFEKYMKIIGICALVFLFCIIAGCSLTVAFDAFHATWDMIYIASITPAKLLFKGFIESIHSSLF